MARTVKSNAERRKLTSPAMENFAPAAGLGNATSASVLTNEIPVEHTICDGREFLKFSVPNGWDDVKKVCRKVLLFQDRKFRYSCWNSDHNYCVFVHVLGEDIKTARFA